VSTSILIFGVVIPWLVVALFVALGCWIGFQLIHQNGRLLSRLETLEQRLAEIKAAPAPMMPMPAPMQAPMPEPQPAPAGPSGLPLGSPAPVFTLPDLDGAQKSLADFRGRRLLIVFFNPGCGFCTRMAPDLAALPTEAPAVLPLVVTTGAAEDNRKLVTEYGIRCPVLLQQGMEVASQYQCNGTPMGYLIDEQGNIASEMGIGGPALITLASAPAAAAGNGAGPLGGKRGIEESKIERNGLAGGTPAPNFTLPLLHGGELSLEEYRGRPVLLVFSDPNCGPCDQLSPQLEQLSRRTPGIQVLMVSRGDVEANRAKAAEHGLTFPVVLQRQWEVSRDYAMFATPVAYLIDEQGVIVSDVAVGVEPILALLSTPVPSTNGKEKGPHRGKESHRRR
jgi:peroxiredoxin